jgi:Contact-dependent growth inhibition CdiA C-terminal domain
MKSLICYLKISSKNAFTHFSIFWVGAALSVGVFWGCSKEETLDSVTTNSNDVIPAIRKISVDDVKKWYKEPVASGSLGSRSDGIKTALGAVPLFPIAFQTTGTHIDSFYNGKVEYVITPVRASSLIPTSRFQGNFLLFNRTAQGNIESKLIVFYADEDAYKDSTKVINFQNFTGQMIFLDENNKVQKYQKMVNGVVVQKNYSALSLKVIADGLTGDNTGVGLSTRCDDSDPGSCYNGWGTSGWSKFWGAVGRALSWVAGSGTGGGDARSFGSSVNDGFDSDLSYVQANRSPHASDNGGGGPETNPKQIWCTNLLSGWQDDKLQAVLDGEIPASHYNGYITTTSRAELEFRNKLREFQAVMQCEHVHKMNEMPEFTNTAYDYYVAKGRSAVAREKIAEVLFYLAEHPEHTNVINENAPNYFNKYNVANFSISEFVKLASDPVLFAQVDGFLNQNGFNADDVKAVKIFNDPTGNDPVFQIDGQEFTGKQMVYADRIVRKIFDKNRNNVDIRSKLDEELNKLIQTELGKKMLFPDGIWNPDRYKQYKELLLNIWEDHFEASIVSPSFYDQWNSTIINANNNTETAYYMQQRGVAARSKLELFGDVVIETVVELFSMIGTFRPMSFTSEGRIIKLNHAPRRGTLEIDPTGNFSTSERKSAQYLQNLGKNVQLRKPTGLRAANGSTSDLVVDGVTYDVYTPFTSNAGNIIGRIFEKRTQANGVVLDLSRSGVNPADFRDIMKRLNGAAKTKGIELNIEQVFTINTNQF